LYEKSATATAYDDDVQQWQEEAGNLRRRMAENVQQERVRACGKEVGYCGSRSRSSNSKNNLRKLKKKKKKLLSSKEVFLVNRK
jgi:hypothetical protein